MRKLEIFVQPSHEDLCAALRGRIDLSCRYKVVQKKRWQKGRHLQHDSHCPMRELEIFVQPSHEDLCCFKGSNRLVLQVQGGSIEKIAKGTAFAACLPLPNAKVGNIRTA